MTCFLLASIWLRLFAGAASTASIQEPYRPDVGDRWLPVYSVVVALHKEARVVPQLIAALDAIDYPVLWRKLTKAMSLQYNYSINGAHHEYR
jgi:cellulose synthase/poly-beta-1,6-N-acetylglucosamine synthase-like glycosyltransferase